MEDGILHKVALKRGTRNNKLIPAVSTHSGNGAGYNLQLVTQSDCGIRTQQR